MSFQVKLKDLPKKMIGTIGIGLEIALEKKIYTTKYDVLPVSSKVLHLLSSVQKQG